MNRARGFGAVSVALGLLFVACGGDDGGDGDDEGEAGSAGSSSGKGGGAGQGGSAGKGGKGGSTGTGGTNAASGGTSGRGGSAGTGAAGEAGASAGQGASNGGNGGDPSAGGSAQAGESNGGSGSGGDDSSGASGTANGGQATGGDGNGAGGAGGDSTAGGAGGRDHVGGANGGDEVAGAGGGEETAGAGGGESAPVITVFDGGTRSTGATWSGRSGLDNLCQSAKTAQGIAGGSPHALISVSAADDIADFPALYGLPADRAFASASGAVIADDFADLLDGTLDLSIEAAGILLGEPGLWFTGSNADGTASTNTCQGWTTTIHSNEIRANYGYTGNTNSWWLDGSATATCAAVQYHILCVTWE